MDRPSNVVIYTEHLGVAQYPTPMNCGCLSVINWSTDAEQSFAVPTAWRRFKRTTEKSLYSPSKQSVKKKDRKMFLSEIELMAYRLA